MADKKKKEPDRGMRTEWKEIQARKRQKNIIALFACVVVLGGVVGAGIVFKDKILEFINKPAEQPKVAKVEPPPPPLPDRNIEKPVPPPPLHDAPPPPLEKKVPIEAQTESIVPGEEAEAKKLIASGRAALEKFDFVGAKGLFVQATHRKAGSRMRIESETWAKKAECFEVATRHIKVSDFALADDAYLVETSDGRLLRGIPDREDSENLVLQAVPMTNPASTGISKLTIPKSDIAKTTRIALQQRHDEFLSLVDDLYKNVQVQRSTDYYDIVYLSKRLGLGHECMEFLAKAYDGGPGHAPDPYLDQSFRKEVVHRGIDHASFLLASGSSKARVESELKRITNTLPNYGFAVEEVEAFRLSVLSKVKDNFKSTLVVQKPKVVAAVSAPKTAKQLSSEEDVEVTVMNDGVKGRGAAASVVEKANSRYEEGMKLYRGFKQGTNGNNNQALRAAMLKLREAVDLYDQALKTDPNNDSIVNRQTEANMIVYACEKYQTL